MAKGIEVVIEFVIAAVTVVTGIILFGYSPGFTNSEGQLIISDSGIAGIALVIVGLLFFGFSSIHFIHQDFRLAQRKKH
ncbi:MAG TPA: hypothetical protein VED17_06465 [Nitrososphaerales archaeon]|nr:hypothetical protein [Nitrososphaerales archaeon]